MSGTGFKAIHKITVKDIGRNHWLAGTLLISLAVCAAMEFLGGAAADEKRWMAYAVFIYITVFATPLLYFIRYGDRNRRIISALIYTKICGTALYQFLFGAYQTAVLGLGYAIVFILVALINGVGVLDIYLLLSVLCVLCIANGACMFCMVLFKRYYVALAVYMAACVFFLMSNSVAAGFLFPIHFEGYRMAYFGGKLAELIIISAANIVRLHH